MGFLDPKPLSLAAAGDTYLPLSQRSAANGVATLDAGAKIPVAQIPTLTAYESGTSNVIFVTPAGSDTNDGKTWVKAKATVGGALTALAGGAGVIEVGAGTITETAAWGTVPGNTVIAGRSKRATTIVKAFSGNLVTRLADGAEIRSVTIDGQGATYTGYGFLITGTDGNQIFTDATLKNMDGPCIDFAVGAGSGFKATNLEAYRVSAGTGTGRYAINISDTQQLAAVPRSFVALTTAGQCAINFGGCNDTLVTNSFLADVRFTPDTRGVNMVATRIANQAALTIDGHNNSIVACDINPQVTIAASADAVTIGPGSFNNLPVIDSSGNNRNNVTHWEIACTPTLTSGGTAPVLGNGVMTGWWSRTGATVTVNVEFTVGSTTTLGTGGLRFSLPVARTTGTVTSVGIGVVTGGATNYTCAVRIPGAVNYCELIRDTSGSVTFNSPATFTTGDTFRFTGTYML